MSWRFNAPRATETSSPTLHQSNFGSRCPDCIRAAPSKFCTSRLSLFDAVSISAANALWLALSGPDADKDEVALVIAARGVRSSCETELSRVRLKCSDWARELGIDLRVTEPLPVNNQRDLADEGFQECSLLEAEFLSDGDS